MTISHPLRLASSPYSNLTHHKPTVLLEMLRYVSTLLHAFSSISETQTVIQIDASGTYYEVGRSADSSGGASKGGGAQKLETAEISLNDCLACRCVCVPSPSSLSGP
jgi:hypothetical protein